MKLEAILKFEKFPDKKTRYVLFEHTGNYVHNFPSVYIDDKHPHKGEKYIILTEYWGKQSCPITCVFTHMFSFAKNRFEKNKECIGLNFFPDFPCKTYGVFMDDALLIQFSDDWNKITIYYFKDERSMAYTLFKEWISGKLEMALEKKCLRYSSIKNALWLVLCYVWNPDFSEG
ncbi:MAG: hypothetical protein LBV17_01265 [Treponema sp.]|jgi:hypothetical protein|nr:hypothetical protein [Treponema sp.]